MRNRLDKIRRAFVVLIIFAVMVPHTIYANPAASQDGADSPSDWAIEIIDNAKEIDLVPEKMLGEYRNSITREQFSELAVNLYKALDGKEDKTPGENPFTDTQNSKVVTAYLLGIVKGKGDGLFDPDNTVTREEISVMLYRTLQAAKPEYDYSNSIDHMFVDQSDISSWAAEAVGYLYSIEVINGVGDNCFNPKGNTTKEEAIVLAMRMHDKALAAENASENALFASRGSVQRQENVMKLKLQELISQELGKPYKWGGTGPDGYDCSGLVYALYKKLGITLPRTSKGQASAGTYVAKEDLAYGDIVLFARDGKNINHAGIYVGNGEFVHSPQSGDVVKFTTLMSGYYANCYYTARRVLP
jgi:hypothetical protein